LKVWQTALNSREKVFRTVGLFLLNEGHRGLIYSISLSLRGSV